MTKYRRPKRTKPIGKRYCERCQKMHSVMPEGFDFVKEEMEQMTWDMAEQIDAEILRELLSGNGHRN